MKPFRRHNWLVLFLLFQVLCFLYQIVGLEMVTVRWWWSKIVLQMWDFDHFGVMRQSNEFLFRRQFRSIEQRTFVAKRPEAHRLLRRRWIQFNELFNFSTFAFGWIFKSQNSIAISLGWRVGVAVVLNFHIIPLSSRSQMKRECGQEQCNARKEGSSRSPNCYLFELATRETARWRRAKYIMYR